MCHTGNTTVNKSDIIYSDEELTTITQSISSYDDNTTFINDINIDFEDNSDDTSSNSSCDDSSRVCSCCHSDISSSDDENNFDIADEITKDKTTFDSSQVEGNRIMFPQSNLSVFDVLLMIEMFSISKNLTKSDQIDLMKLIKILAGPDFELWNCSYH